MTLQTLTLTGLLAFCLPMAASQTSSSLTDMAGSHNETRSAKPFSQIPAAMQIAQGNDMSTSICEYLGYKDYAHIAPVSRLLHGMMHRCLYLQPRPLLLPEAPQLIEYTKKLLDNATDEGRLSAVKSLISLCERSYYPGQDLLNAFLLYRTDVPFAERICSIIKTSRLNNFRLVKKDDLLTDIANTHRLLEKQGSALQEHKEKLATANLGENKRLSELREQYEATKERMEQHTKILKTWQPYGLLLRLAMRYPTDHITDLRVINATFSHAYLNIFAAPQICDTNPILDVRAFMEACFLDGDYSRDQRIDALLPRFRYLEMRNGAVDGCTLKAPGSLAGLQRFKQEAIERLFFHADQALLLQGEWFLGHSPESFLKIIDEITQHEYELVEVYNLDPLGARHWMNNLRLIIEDELRKKNLSRWDYRRMCVNVAQTYSNPQIKEIYYKKAADSVNMNFKCPEIPSPWEPGMLFETSRISQWLKQNFSSPAELREKFRFRFQDKLLRDTETPGIYQWLEQNCSDPKERAKYRSQFRWVMLYAVMAHARIIALGLYGTAKDAIHRRLFR